MGEIWQPATFEIAYHSGPCPVSGYTYRGLGLHIVIHATVKKPPTWILTHLGSGHRIVAIKGKVAVAFPIASEIAEAGDWDFLSLVGWKDRFPDAAERVREISNRYPAEVSGRASGVTPTDPRGLEVAQQIASNRP